MNKKEELELFYILPYTKRYDSGGYYRNDDTGCLDYRHSSLTIWNGKSSFFDNKEELLNWFYENIDERIPIVYRIKYIENYKGLNDIIKLTNLSNNTTTYHTMLNSNMCAYYDENKSESCGKDVWERYPSYSSSEKFSIKDIYNELRKRGIKIKCNLDKLKCFDFIGDPFYEKEKAKGKKLVLYRPSPKRFW